MAHPRSNSDIGMSEAVDRLVVEAGKYLGQPAGATIDRKEVRLQAEANGYGDSEARAMLADLPDPVTIPDQGNLFGEMWPGNQSLEPVSGTLVVDSPSTIQQFNDYCSDNTYEWQNIERYNHTFNKNAARKRFAQAKNVDRHFAKEHDTYSTVVLTYCADESGTDIAQQAEAFYPRAVVRLRRKILKDLGVYDSYAGVSVLAPKYKSDDTTLCAVTPTTHAHSFLWIPGKVSADDFHPLIETHIKTVEGGTVDQHTTDDNRLTGASITVEHWGTQYCEPLPQGPKDMVRGPTSSLPYELGNNLPWLKHPSADYVKEWSAGMWQGENSNTVARWKPMGRPSRFKELAERMNYYTKLREGAFAAQAIDGTLVANTPSANPQPSHNPSRPAMADRLGTEALNRAVAQFARVDI